MFILWYLRNLTLPSFRQDVLPKNGYFFFNEINVCCHEINNFKLFLRTKVSQNAFNFSQLESYAYSEFQCDTLL